jgi:ferredoxin-NADP reductase
VPDVLTLTVRQVVKATPTSRILRLDLAGIPFRFRAGQAAMFGLHGRSDRRPYSIASAPEEARERQLLEFLVKVDPNGDAGSHLAGMRKGMRVDLEGPLGSFQFPVDPVDRRVLFIAGGTGIAPLRSMLWHVLEGDRAASVGLFYSARSPAEFAYGAELRRLDREGRITLRLTATRDATIGWRGDRGRINLHRLSPLVEDPATLCFVCGPPSLIEVVPPLLRQLGVTDARIRTEEW